MFCAYFVVVVVAAVVVVLVVVAVLLATALLRFLSRACFVLCDSQEPHTNGGGMSHRTIGIRGKESEKPRNIHMNMMKCHVRIGRRWEGALPSHFFPALFSSRCAAPPKGYCWSSSISSSMPLSLSSPLSYE